jgi:energy-coupling factor transport system ATP-binding protein
LEAQGLRQWYDAESQVLRGVDLAVPAGQFVALVGANGSGKTTLAKHFIGLLHPREGLVRVSGEDTGALEVGALARRVGFLFQHPEQQIFSATVRQEVAFGPQNQGLAVGEVQNRVAAALSRFGLEAVADRPPAILSYGLRRRVTLASLAALDTPILILDEPVVGLDARERHDTLAWLQDLHGAGRTILLITHDMGLVAEYAQRMLVLGQGRLLADGPPSELFRQPELLAQAFLSPPPVVALAQALSDGQLAQAAHCRATTVQQFVNWFVASVRGQP